MQRTNSIGAENRRPQSSVSLSDSSVVLAIATVVLVDLMVQLQKNILLRNAEKVLRHHGTFWYIGERCSTLFSAIHAAVRRT